jgi:MarR family 2-MHQ and catechol resistance regulon transcriptional repressor
MYLSAVILSDKEVQGGKLRLWVVLARAFQAISEHDRKSIADHGLTPGEFAVLEVLLHRGPLLLATKGLVERRACPEDRRASFVALTEQGEAVIREAFPAHAETLERALGGLSPAETRDAIRLIRKAGLHAQALLDDPPVTSDS